MSKPNLLAFSTSVGFYRNKRVRDLRGEIAKSNRRKIDFCEMAPLLFQVTMAYAAENQLDGNFAGYSIDDWIEIFAHANITVTAAEAAAILKGFHQTGLFDGDKIRSWMKFNRHLADYEGIVRAKRRAGKIMQQKRQQEARAALRNGQPDAPNPEQNHENKPPKTAPKPDPTSRQIWLLNQQLEATSDPQERKQLKQQKRELLRQHTGVEPASPSPAPPLARSERKLSDKDRESQNLLLARSTLKDYPDGLNDSMVRALVKHNVKLPDDVRRKFQKLFVELEEASNPVPE